MLTEDEIKRRMEQARARGWNEDTINRFAAIDRARMNSDNYQQAFQQKQQQQEDVKKNEPDAFKSFLVNTGALLGNIATGVGSVALAPVTGGASIVGGAAASAGIEALRRSLLNEEITPEALATEGALALIPGMGAVRGLTRGAKVVDAAGNIIKSVGETGAKTAAKEVTKRDLAQQAANGIKGAFKPSPTPGFVSRTLQSAGAKVQGRARGVVPGRSIPGQYERLSPREADEINGFLNSQVKTKGSAEKQWRQLQSFEKQALDELDTAVAKNNKKIAQGDLIDILKGAEQKIVGANGTGIVSMSKAEREYAVDLAKKLEGIEDAKGLHNFRKTLDNEVNYARAEGRPDPVKEQIASAFRKPTDEMIAKRLPAIKDFDQKWAMASRANKALMRNADPSGLQVAGSFNNRGILGRQFQAGGSALGRAGVGLGKAISTPAAQQAGQFGLRRVVNPGEQNGAAEAFDTSQLPPDIQQLFEGSQDPNEQAAYSAISQGITDPQEMTDAIFGQGAYASGGAGGAGGGSGLQYSSADLMNTAFQYLQSGDLKTATTLMNFADQAAALEKQYSAGGAGGKLSAAAQKTLMGTDTANSLIDQIESEVSNVPTGLIGGGLASLQGMFKPEDGAGAAAEAYNQSRGSKALMLIKAIQGSAGQISDADRDAIINAIPLATDSDTIRKQKLTSLRQIVQAYQSSAVKYPSASSGLPDDIQQLFAQGGY